jgi:hypothetical protein
MIKPPYGPQDELAEALSYSLLLPLLPLPAGGAAAASLATTQQLSGRVLAKLWRSSGFSFK